MRRNGGTAPPQMVMAPYTTSTNTVRITNCTVWNEMETVQKTTTTAVAGDGSDGINTQWTQYF